MARIILISGKGGVDKSTAATGLLEWRNYRNAAGFDWASAIGGLLNPWLPIGRIRQSHHIHLRAYAELLRVYLELLEDIRNPADGHQPSASKRETYHLDNAC